MPGKFKIIVSDLHLSAGHVREGNPLEDFDQDVEFAALLDEVAAESDRDGAEVELIVNGDAFEMLQVPHVELYDPSAVYLPQDYHSSSEQDSALKMAIIIASHRPFFAALGRFLRVGPPRRSVTFIKGNHDVNLHWRAVQDLVRQALGATGGRDPLLVFESRRVSREGIYVEHGNQYGEVVDRIEDMEEPHDHDHPGQLAIPPGSWFVMDVFNEVEREKYWIDGIKPITALVFYALLYDFAFAARSIATLAKRLPGILDEIVFDDAPPGVTDPVADLVSVAQDPAEVEKVADRYSSDAAFRAEFNARLARMVSPSPATGAADPLPIPATPDSAEVGQQIRARVHSSLHQMAGVRAVEEGVKLVVFGHTHDAGVEALPGDGVYINSGTWTWRADFTGADKSTWRDLFEHPERFTGDRLLSYVRIDYDDQGQPSGRLLAYEPRKPQPEPAPPVPPETLSLWQRVKAWFERLGARIADWWRG
jgi:UDP-2,3-diacylglucosamine pyrophosphatase LpxH